MKRSDSVESVHLLTARQASELIPGVGAQALLRWARQGQIPHVRFPNGRVYFRRSDVEALLEPVVMKPEGSRRPFEGLPLSGFAAAV